MFDVDALIKPDRAYQTIGSTRVFDSEFSSAEWIRQQSESVKRYQDSTYEEDETLGVLFGGFAAATLDRTGVVLDIGCGLHSDQPHYVKHLGLEKYIGIEPLTAPVERRYACLSGVIAEDLPLRDASAVAAMFATSLDHIEDPHTAIAEALRALKTGSPLYFWLGVHDPHLLAEAKTFGVVHNHSSGLRKLARVVGAPFEHLHLMNKMHAQARKLEAGIPLDDAHARYHTAAGIDREMASYGLQLVRRVLVPGSTSLFVEARAAGSASLGIRQAEPKQPASSAGQRG